MTTALTWKPITYGRSYLPDELKFVLRKNLLKDNSSIVLDSTYCNYFAALRDSGVEGAEEVLELIEEHDEIILYEE